MKPDDFISTCLFMPRSSADWQESIATQLGVTKQIVRDWLQDGQIPPWVDVKLTELMGLRGATPWPRDEWMIGLNVTTKGKPRQYVVHLAPPRFCARVIDCTDHGMPVSDELPVDLSLGIVCRAGPETIFCEFDWIDQPEPNQIPHLLKAAANAIIEIDSRMP